VLGPHVWSLVFLPRQSSRRSAKRGGNDHTCGPRSPSDDPTPTPVHVSRGLSGTSPPSCREARSPEHPNPKLNLPARWPGHKALNPTHHHENAEKATREGTETLHHHRHHRVSTEHRGSMGKHFGVPATTTTRSAERHTNTAPGAGRARREGEAGDRAPGGQSLSGHLH